MQLTTCLCGIDMQWYINIVLLVTTDGHTYGDCRCWFAHLLGIFTPWFFLLNIVSLLCSLSPNVVCSEHYMYVCMYVCMFDYICHLILETIHTGQPIIHCEKK